MHFFNLKTFIFQRFFYLALSAIYAFYILISPAKAFYITQEDYAAQKIKESLRIQFKDMSLIDCSDVRGVCALKHFTKGKYWNEPPVFYVKPPRKGEFSFCIIGSAHFMPLQVFGNKLDALLSTAKHLIVEGDQRGKLTRSALENIGAITDTQQEYEDFLYSLTYKQRIIFEAENSALFSYYKIQNIQPYEIFNPFMIILRSQLYHLGMDEEIMNRMEENNKPIKTLEGLESTLSLLNMFPADWQMHLRLSVATSSQNGLNKFADAEDFLKLALSNNYDAIIRSLDVNTCTVRNFEWLTHLINYSKTTPNCVVVVGLAHLLGQESVLALLRDSGYQIQFIGDQI